jgi:hypothetical protein
MYPNPVKITWQLKQIVPLKECLFTIS